MTTAILGASDKPESFSHRALSMLQRHGHKVIPVHPALAEIEGIAVVPSLEEITEPVDTLILYLRPERAEALAEQMVGLVPRRVIFNPGTESESIAEKLDAAGIETVNACTLVLLQSRQF